MAKTIAICNQKGGVGKTTTTLNLGIGLAREGKKVLLIDGDPQSDLTTSLGWDADSIENSLGRLMYLVTQNYKPDVKDTILHHPEGVDLIPSNLDLSSMETQLVNAMSREKVLANLLKDVKKDYNYILIDCMPSLGMITINALTAADSVVIPVQAQYLPAKGMTQLMKSIDMVRNHTNDKLQIGGIVMTLVEPYLTDCILSHDVAVKAAEASKAGMSIFAYDKDSKPAKAYEQLTREVMKHGERERHRNEASITR